MENPEQQIEDKKVEARKEKIKSWLKNPYNLALIGILIFAFIIRLYYFNLTKAQPLWWDEAEYMLKAKNIALGTPDTGWGSNVRPVLFPFLASFFFRIGFGEIALRFFLILVSISGILFLYLLGKELFNQRIALIASSFMVFFYIDLFYTMRLMVDVSQVFLTLLTSFLFIKYKFGNGSKKLVWFILPILFLGVLFRFTMGLFIGVLLIFLLLTENIKLFKAKEWYVSLFFGIAIVVPIVLLLWNLSGNPLYPIYYVLSTASGAQSASADQPGQYAFFAYLNYFSNYTTLFFSLLFVLGLLLIIASFVLKYDRIFKDTDTKKYLYLLMWIIVPMIYFGFVFNHFEDRYIYLLFPPIFVIMGIALDKIYLSLTKYSKFISVLFVFAFLIFGYWQMISHSDQIIKSKVYSYQGLKDAGLWIKEHSSKEDTILNTGLPENTYYSERATKSPNEFASKEDFDKYIQENKPKYLVLSIWEHNPDWMQSWIQNSSEKINPVKAFYLDEQQQQVSAVIYEITFSYKNQS